MTSIRILIVENEFLIAEDIRISLTDAGHDVIGVVTTGEQAIEFCKSQQPDIVFMDIKLQGELDGIKTASMIQQWCKDTHVVFMTALQDSQFNVKGPILKKPFTGDELKELVEQYSR